MNAQHQNRWRLILGRYGDRGLGFAETGSRETIRFMKMDRLLDYLYNREFSEDRGVRGPMEGTDDGTSLTVPEWIGGIRELFPRETVEVLEKHALDKYDLKELLEDKEVLEKLEPNMGLLKTILQMKHIMKGDVLAAARKIVAQVVAELKAKISRGIRTAVLGALDKSSRGRVKTLRNLDFKRTIRANLKNYDKTRNRLIPANIYFSNRTKHYIPWHLIFCVDESGSMADAVIHSAVMAGIFAGLPMLKTHLLIFDTEVVDLTDYVDDAVQTLMSVQLGGGTDIGLALAHAAKRTENPHRTIIVLVTDLCEGGSKYNMYAEAAAIVESGAKLLILTSLDLNAKPIHNKTAARKMAKLGADVAALTPKKLAEWISGIIA